MQARHYKMEKRSDHANGRRIQLEHQMSIAAHNGLKTAMGIRCIAEHEQRRAVH